MEPYDGVEPPRIVEHDWAEPDLLLMVDEQLIDEADGATFELCALEKHDGPTLRATEPWEGGIDGEPQPIQNDPLDGTVLHDPYRGLFHLWYRTHNRLLRGCSDPARGTFKPIGSWSCHATSRDGIHWTRSRLGRVPFEGSVDNNMFDITGGPVLSDHLSGVVPNYTGSGPALVATAYSRFDDDVYKQGIVHLFSDNGIDWNPHFPPGLSIDGDAHSLMWDSRSRCYLCTTRSAAQASLIRRLQKYHGLRELRNKRHVALAKSRDLIHWTPMLTILEADEQDGENAQLYHMYIVPYGHLYLGFVQLFYMEKSMHFGPLDMHLCYSRDLETWHRMSKREPMIRRGDAGAWDQSHVSITTNRPHPEGHRMRFWYGGKDTEHWQSGYAGFNTGTLRRDGFACWHVGASGGTVTTAPLQANWATWPMLNVDATNGEARLEICDADGKPLPGCAAEDCQPIRGDHLRARTIFSQQRGTFVRHTGPVRFRIHLRDARLYALKTPNIACTD